MREQDYMKIMNNLREDYISEAVSWDGTAQKNRRSIKRLSLGVGAIAAAFAVVVGGIGYGVYRERLSANSKTDSENSEIALEQLNLFGGHGEIRGYTLSRGGCFFRDDTNFYCYDAKWAIDGSSPIFPNEKTDLLTDGERLYTQHDNTLYITDSYGKETVFYTPETEMTFEEIWHLGGDNYFVKGVKITDDPGTYETPLPYTNAGFGVVFSALLNSAAKTLTETPEYITSYQISPEKGGLYWYAPEKKSIQFMPADDANNSRTVYSGAENAESWGVDAETDLLYYEVIERRDTEAGSDTAAAIYTLMPDDAENKTDFGIGYRGDYNAALIADPENDYPCYSYFTNQHCYGVMQKQTESGLHLRVMRNNIAMDDGEQVVFDVPMSDLYKENLPDRMVRPEMVFLDTGDYLIFNLPTTDENSSGLVQVNLETGAWFLRDENASGDQPENSGDPVQQDSDSGLYGEDLASGYCSPQDFPQYYIPPENIDTDNIECYRMLPFAKASASALDTAAIGAHLPSGGAWSKRDPDAKRMTYDEAFNCITNGSVLNAWVIMEELCKLSGGYDAEAYLEDNMLSDREFWLDDSGKEFFYVILYGTDGVPEEIYHAEFYFFEYDENEKQYRYTMLPDRSQQRMSGRQTNGMNFLGGTGIVHPLSRSLAEDDEWYYDLEYARRARKDADAPELTYEPLPDEIQQRVGPKGALAVMTDGISYYEAEGSSLYRLDNDGSRHSVRLDCDETAGIDPDSIAYYQLYMMEDDKLFVLIGAETEGSREARLIPLLVDVKGDVVTPLTSQGDTAEEQLQSWVNGSYTPQRIYTASHNGSMLNLYRAEDYSESCISLDLTTHADVHLTGDKWFVGEDGKLWFIWQNGWYSMELDDRKDDFLEPKLVSDMIPNFEVCEPIRGTMKMLTYLSPYESAEQTGVKLCNYDGTDAEELLKDSPCTIRGAFCDNGVYHIAADAGSADDPQHPLKTVFITKDGSSVSSVGVRAE